ncbi:nucleoside deaminase [Patulibacter sp. NPDC049589]|uniref:nucleoside deaminase n=1 Tax=Patulibacter sp. NPDC049589 TaxID=3154731 RepID=UPI003443DF61
MSSASGTHQQRDAVLGDALERVVQRSLECVEDGGIPFAAIVVDAEGRILGSGVNRVIADHDALAHAEVVAMRDAARRGGRRALLDCVLVASGEPCGLCYLAARHFGVGRIVFAADRHAAAAHGFDYRSSYRVFQTPPEGWWRPPARQVDVAGALRPFERWLEVRR